MTLPKLKLKFSKPSNPCLTWKKRRKTEKMMNDDMKTHCGGGRREGGIAKEGERPRKGERMREEIKKTEER